MRIINFKTFNADITVSEGVITPSAIRAAAPTIAIRYNQPFLRFLPKKKVQEYPFPFVICSKSNDHIFDCRLKSKGPNNTGKSSFDVFIERHIAPLGSCIHNCFHYVKRRGTNISKNNS
jgi:hypothetical protein